MATTPQPLGATIRALGKYYSTTRSMNDAVNAWRRARGSKNWAAAAVALLEAHEEISLLPSRNPV